VKHTYIDLRPIFDTEAAVALPMGCGDVVQQLLLHRKRLLGGALRAAECAESGELSVVSCILEKHVRMVIQDWGLCGEEER